MKCTGLAVLGVALVTATAASAQTTVTREVSEMPVETIITRSPFGMTVERRVLPQAGEVITAPVNEGVVVARLRDVQPPAATDLAKQEPELESNVRQGMANSLAAAVTQAFADRYPAQVNQAAVDSIVSTAR